MSFYLNYRQTATCKASARHIWIWDDCLHTNAVCALELNTRACAVHSAEPTLPWHMAGQICSRQKCSLWQSICFDEKLQTFVQSGQTRERKAEKIQIVCQHVQVHRNVDSNKASRPVPSLSLFFHPPSLHEAGEKGHVGLPVPLRPLCQLAHHVGVARGGGQQQ